MTTNVDPKVLARIKKLLALAADGGATEGEAANAAEMARKMMADNAISMATIENAGGTGEARTADKRHGHTGKKWMRDIMRALAAQAFVTVDYDTGGVDKWSGEKKRGQWQLWGRESAVITTKLMHEYLVRTVDRMARERGTPTDELFKSAMGERIAERIEERHESAMAQQAREAREKNAAARHPSASSNALVVVLEDFAQKERDLNEDMRWGRAPGTTAQKRLERQNKELAEQAERDRINAEKQKRYAEFEEQGVEWDVAFYVIEYGMTLERAAARHAAEKKAEKVETDEQRKKRQAREEREREQWYERQRRSAEREAMRQRHPSFRAGRSAGDSVGLDAQVNKGPERRKLT